MVTEHIGKGVFFCVYHVAYAFGGEVTGESISGASLFLSTKGTVSVHSFVVYVKAGMESETDARGRKPLVAAAKKFPHKKGRYDGVKTNR